MGDLSFVGVFSSQPCSFNTIRRSFCFRSVDIGHLCITHWCLNVMVSRVFSIAVYMFPTQVQEYSLNWSSSPACFPSPLFFRLRLGTYLVALYLQFQVGWYIFSVVNLCLCSEASAPAILDKNFRGEEIVVRFTGRVFWLVAFHVRVFCPFALCQIYVRTNLGDFIVWFHKQTSYNTLVEIPEARTSYGKYIRSYYVPAILNNIPHDIRAIHSKRKLKKSFD